MVCCRQFSNLISYNQTSYSSQTSRISNITSNPSFATTVLKPHLPSISHPTPSTAVHHCQSRAPFTTDDYRAYPPVHLPRRPSREHFDWKDMDVDTDHYGVLGLPTGEEGARLSEKEISKAYRAKALVLHPDKRPNDLNAHANFQRLKSSYEILKDEKARKLFDDLLRVKREKEVRQSKQDSKRRKMVSDLEERERAAFAPDPTATARDEEEIITRKLQEEIARIRAMHANKGATTTSTSREKETRGAGGAGAGLDKEKVLKVSWEKVGDGYSSERLRELFSKFGGVEDVVIKSSKKRGSALVVMANEDAAVAATGTVSGELSNPLLVLPLRPVVATAFQDASKWTGPDINLVGAGYQAFEDEVLKKLQKAAQKQK